MKSYEQNKKVYLLYTTKELCMKMVLQQNIEYLNLNYIMIMSNILDNLCFKEKYNVRERHQKLN
jgi:hypothetical protein